jgi:hypothetical protein
MKQYGLISFIMSQVIKNKCDSYHKCLKQLFWTFLIIILIKHTIYFYLNIQYTLLIKFFINNCIIYT